MGTHPIFESDFDCLTDGKKGSYSRSFCLARRMVRRSPFLIPPPEPIMPRRARRVEPLHYLWRALYFYDAHSPAFFKNYIWLIYRLVLTPAAHTSPPAKSTLVAAHSATVERCLLHVPNTIRHWSKSSAQPADRSVFTSSFGLSHSCRHRSRCACRNHCRRSSHQFARIDAFHVTVYRLLLGLVNVYLLHDEQVALWNHFENWRFKLARRFYPGYALGCPVRHICLFTCRADYSIWSESEHSIDSFGKESQLITKLVKS